ncbi:hypothetical protein [Solicola sp. PLA-1-18]|uniref:hypothetical protein n=1 Tax=Solicola sp. PLA-1-18 TaxID=3380532 RepID=UPI003B7A5F5D
MTDVPIGAVAYAGLAVWTIWNARRRLAQARDGAFDEMDPLELEGIRQTFTGAWPRWVQAVVVGYPVVLGLVLWSSTPYSALYVVLAGSTGGWVVAVASPAALLAIGAAGWAWVWVCGDEAEPEP